MKRNTCDNLDTSVAYKLVMTRKQHSEKFIVVHRSCNCSNRQLHVKTTTHLNVNNDQQIQCFYNGRAFHFKCLKPEHQHITPNKDRDKDKDGPVWATVSGVGPPKSGSTEFIQLLQTHPNISQWVATSKKVSNLCFLITMQVKVLSPAQSYFHRKECIKHVEKTPAYAYSTTAPYLMRAFLKKDHVKLVYTVRDAGEEDASWCLHPYAEYLSRQGISRPYVAFFYSKEPPSTSW